MRKFVTYDIIKDVREDINEKANKKEILIL